MENLTAIRDKLIILDHRKKELTARKESLSRQLKAAEEDVALKLKAQRLIQEASQLTLETISVRINKIVTSALKAVLDDPYEFDLGFKIAYGKLSTDMMLIRDDIRYDLTEDVGDGVVDITALALRSAVLCLDKRKLRRTLLMDEPMGALSVGYQAMAGRLFKHLSDRLKMQVIMIASHGSRLEFGEDEAKIFDSADFVPGAVL